MIISTGILLCRCGSDAVRKKPRLGAASAECVFLDVVAYSERTIESQAAIIDALNRIVRESVRACKLGPDHVIYLPTGDGICISLLDVSDPPDIQMRIALGILRRLHKHNSRAVDKELDFKVRVGINSNRDNVIIDINGNPNVSGDGINMSARIMNKADGCQILVGEPVFGILRKRREYASAFRPYTAIVKHDLALPVYQFVGTGYAYLNVDVPRAFQTLGDIKARKGLKASEFRRALRAEGLTIRIEVGPSDAEVQWAKLAGVTLNKPLRIAALIDTGASRTVINPQVAVTCGLRQVGEAVISTAGHVGRVPEYVGAVHFPESNLSSVDPVRFIACPLPQQAVACLIGRDVLEQWRLVYDGRTGEVKIEE
jgi:predicted aspartyl protease